MSRNYGEVALGTIAEFSYGHTATAQDNGDIRFLRITDIDENGLLKKNGAKFIDFTNDLEKYKVKKGDLLVARTGGTFGKTLYYKNDESAVYASFLIKIILNTARLMPEYYFHFSQSNKYWFQANNLVTGGGQPQFIANILKEIAVPLPPLSEQKAIADLLSTWDMAIEKTERLIKAKEHFEKSLILKLLFGKVRIGGRRTTVVKVKRWLSIPSDWKVVKIGFVSKEVSDRNQNGDDVPVLSCTKYDGLVDSLKYFDKQIYSKDTSTYKVVAHGQFAYATNHIEEGSIGYQDLYPQGLVSPMYTVFETDKRKVNDGYLYKLLKTETYRRIFEIKTNASVDRRGSLRWKEFSKLPIPFPSIDEQMEINEVLDAAQREVDLLKGRLELLKKQKRGLMQKLLTGQWRVSVFKEQSQ